MQGRYPDAFYYVLFGKRMQFVKSELFNLSRNCLLEGVRKNLEGEKVLRRRNSNANSFLSHFFPIRGFSWNLRGWGGLDQSQLRLRIFRGPHQRESPWEWAKQSIVSRKCNDLKIFSLFFLLDWIVSTNLNVGKIS